MPTGPLLPQTGDEHVIKVATGADATFIDQLNGQLNTLEARRVRTTALHPDYGPLNRLRQYGQKHAIFLDCEHMYTSRKPQQKHS